MLSFDAREAIKLGGGGSATLVHRGHLTTTSRRPCRGRPSPRCCSLGCESAHRRTHVQWVTRPKPNRVLVFEVLPFSQSISINCRVFASVAMCPTTVLVAVLMTSPLSPTYT